MKTNIFFTLFALAITLLACTPKEKWPEQTRTDFVGSCESSFVDAFKTGVGDLIEQIDMDKLNDMATSNCTCQYEALKATYDSAEEALSHDVEELLEQAPHCEPTEEQVENLFKK